ncbi:MAG: ribonuclease Y [Fimbriimonadaceae bacterium]
MPWEYVVYIVATVCGIVIAFATVGLLHWVVIRPAKLQLERERADLRREREQLAEEMNTQRNLLTEQRETALRELEVLKREVTMEVRTELEATVKDRLEAFERQEARLLSREESVDLLRKQLDEREQQIRELHRAAEASLAEQTRLEASLDAALLEASCLSKDEAQERYLSRHEPEFKQLAVQKARLAEQEILQGAEKKAKDVVLQVMQRSVIDFVPEASVAHIELPNEEMKGRIIGKEGRNIRFFEQVTGVELIIDETRELVRLSCFDPTRREAARVALINLMLDGRIQPAAIEEAYEKAVNEILRTQLEAATRAAERANVRGLDPKIIEALGVLRFRLSFGQNVLDHSVEVSRLCSMIAEELNVNTEVARRAGLLHDIGKGFPPEHKGGHAVIGMNFLRELGECEEVCLAVGAHHFDIEPTSREAKVLIIADAISGSRPGARSDSEDAYFRRLNALEEMAMSFEGVDKAFALSAGREIRVMVNPKELDEMESERLACDLARKIENEHKASGTVKVTVIRETRTEELAQ